MKKFAVIGLGRFGMMLAKTLARSGVEVIAIDDHKELIEEIKDEVALAVKLDASDEKALLSTGVDKVDAVVVGIGERFESNQLATVLCKKFGIPKVIARAQTPIRAKILKLVGADEVISPEEESAKRLAQRLISPNIIDALELADGHKLVQLKALKDMVGKNLLTLDLRKKYNVNVVALKKKVKVKGRDGKEKIVERINDVPRPEDVIEAEDVLVIVGSDENIEKLMGESVVKERK